MSDDTDYIKVSREYVRAKKAFEISTQSMIRGLEARANENRGPRRPVGSPADFRIAPAPRRRILGAPDISAWFDVRALFERTKMSLHIMAFVEYIEAYRAYYRGQPGELTGAIGKALNLAIDAQLLGQDDADKDLQAFSHALMDERCDDALRAFRRQPTPKNSITSPSERRAVGAMLLTMQEAQMMGATDGPGCRGVVREVTKLYDSGVLP